MVALYKNTVEPLYSPLPSLTLTEHSWGAILTTSPSSITGSEYGERTWVSSEWEVKWENKWVLSEWVSGRRGRGRETLVKLQE